MLNVVISTTRIIISPTHSINTEKDIQVKATTYCYSRVLNTCRKDGERNPQESEHAFLVHLFLVIA